MSKRGASSMMGLFIGWIMSLFRQVIFYGFAML